MRFIYLNAKKYPGTTADHHYVRNIAYAFHKKLNNGFLYVTINTEQDALPDLPTINISIPFFFKKTLVFFFWIPWFCLTKLKGNKDKKDPVVFFSNDMNLLAVLIFWRWALSLPVKIASDWHHLTHTGKDAFVTENSDWAITTSHKLEKLVLKLVPFSRVYTVYGGVDLVPFEGGNSRENLRAELGLPERNFLIGYVGLFKTMGLEKGISTMIEALRELPNDCRMVFVGGKTGEIVEYEKVAEEKGILDRCIFRPLQNFDMVVKYEKAMSALVIPYPDKPHFRDYGFPMKIYEYMASGVPVVYTKLGLLEEVVEDCAYGVAPDSPRELAEQVLRIKSSPEEAHKIAMKALEKVKNYTWEHRAQNILERFAIMSLMLKIPNNALKYILFQRTDFSVYTSRPRLLRVVMNRRIPIYNYAVSLEALLFRGRTKRLFSLDMEREYAHIRPYLPSSPQNILDIGCGVGGIDIMMQKHYAVLGKTPDFFLLDKSEVNSKVYYGIKKEAAYYNSLDIAKKLLVANGAEESKVHVQEVSGTPIFPGKKFDVIVSLLSWGFHYPVDTYLEEVYNVLNPGGILIIDVRKGTEGEVILTHKFGTLKVVCEGVKHRRILVSKK